MEEEKAEVLSDSEQGTQDSVEESDEEKPAELTADTFVLKIDENPQQTVHRFEGVVIRSDFDSGNLATCEQVAPDKFEMRTSVDGLPYVHDSRMRTVFHFAVSGVQPGQTVSFTIQNMNNVKRLYENGMKPFFRATDPETEPGLGY